MSGNLSTHALRKTFCQPVDLPLGAITEGYVDRIFDTNVRGLLFTVQKALPLLANGGANVLTASTASVQGTVGFSICSANEAAVMGRLGHQ